MNSRWAAAKPPRRELLVMANVKSKTVNSINIYKLKMVHEDSVPYAKTHIFSPENIASFAWDAMKLHEEPEENFVIVCLNTKNRIVGVHIISIGSLNSSIVHPREIFKAAMLNNAASIICLHNHPSGDPEPSREDKETTQRIVEAGKVIGINVLDHIVVGENRYTSLKERGLM